MSQAEKHGLIPDARVMHFSWADDVPPPTEENIDDSVQYAKMLAFIAGYRGSVTVTSTGEARRELRVEVAKDD